jgi:hypothetical protein
MLILIANEECPGNLPAFEPPYQALIPDLKVNWYLEYIVSPALHVTKIPSEIPPELAAPLLCGAFRYLLLVLAV